MIRVEKVKRVQEIKDGIEKAKAFYLCDFTGLTVAEVSQLRRNIREKGGLLKVVKNTALHYALKEKGISGFDPYLAGPTAVLYAFEDEIEPLKVAYDYSKEISKLSFKAGWLEGKLYGAKDVEVIATLPGKQDLRAKLVGTLNAPIYKLVMALNWPLQSLVSTLEQIRKQKEEVK